jgi:hypothetical protein
MEDVVCLEPGGTCDYYKQCMGIWPACGLKAGTKYPKKFSAMNQSGKESTVLKSELIDPFKYKYYGVDWGLGKTYIFSTPTSKSNWVKKMFLDYDRVRYYSMMDAELTNTIRKAEKKMNIYSFPLTRCSKNIWATRDGKMIPVNKLPLPHFENVYDKLMRSAWYIVGSQDRIYKVCGDLNYVGRFDFDRLGRTVKFLHEFCPSWHAIAVRAFGENISYIDGRPITWNDIGEQLQITIPRKEKLRMESLKQGAWHTSETERFSSGKENAGGGKSEKKIYPEFHPDSTRRKPEVTAVMDKVKLTNGKYMTDSSGKQFILFPLE